jgi:hypothetical protein
MQSPACVDRGGVVSEPQPHETVWALSTAGFAARCLHVVSDLGVADRIGDEPVPVGELARSCRVDPSALDRVLRLLSTHGVFDRRDDGYGHTPVSRLLREDHPQSMRAFARMMGLDGIWGSLHQLRYAVETGRPGMEKLEPAGAWAYMQARPEEAEIFARAMTAKAGADIAAVLTTYDFTPFHRIADIAGGRGHLLRAVLEAAPKAEGVLFDLPVVIDGLAVDDEPRLTAQAGDFFVDALPAADAYLLMDVLHDWPDEQCAAILAAIRRAAPAGAVLLVIEDVIPEERVDVRPSTLDIIMLTVAGGRERTAGELGGLLARAGFRLDTVLDTPGPRRIVQAACV